MDPRLWCITTLFNPAGYRSRVENYHLFAERLARQKVNLLTVELAFGEQPQVLPAAERTLHLRGHSPLWQKERLLNHALARLPPQCEYVAWLDADVLLPDSWPQLLVERLAGFDFAQLFERVHHLKAGDVRFGGATMHQESSIVWQREHYGDTWMPLRMLEQLPKGALGFAWAARRKALESAGFYDRLILGGNDVFLADALLGSHALHTHYQKLLTPPMVFDMEAWLRRFLAGTDRSVTHVPIDIYHLWHGALQSRSYASRWHIYGQNQFDPGQDLRLAGGVWEWGSAKPGLHEAVLGHFTGRGEDGNEARQVQVLDVGGNRVVRRPAHSLLPDMVSMNLPGVAGEVWVDANHLLCRKPLPAPLSTQGSARVQTLQAALHEVCPLSVEAWEDAFRGDPTPDASIAGWLSVAEIYAHFAGRGLSLEQRRDLFRLILACAVGTELRFTLALPSSLPGQILQEIVLECARAGSPGDG